MGTALTRGLVVASLATVAALTGGCAGSPTHSASSPAGGVPSVTAIPTVPPGQYVALPFDAYALAGDNANTVNRALGILEQKCMARIGFTTWQPPATATAATDTSTLADFPFRPATAADAASVGYHKPGAPTDAIPIADKPSDAEMQALYGFVPGKQSPPSDPHGGGCSKTAFDELNKDRPPLDDNLFSHLRQSATDQTQADSRVQAAFSRWSSCMKQSGFDYRTPADATNSNWTGKQSSSLEIATATTDVNCRQQTNLLGIWIAVLSAYERQLIDVNATKLAAYKAAITFEVQHAAAVVAGS